MTSCSKCGKMFGRVDEKMAHEQQCNPKPCKYCNGTGNDPNVDPAERGGVPVACPGCYGTGGQEQ